jgi:hypothetical protein
MFLMVSVLFFLPDVLAQTEASAPLLPESLKLKKSITINDNLLSVELLDAEFGTIMNEIAEKAKFTVRISGPVSVKRISTRFNDMQIERGIFRLLYLTKEKNYTMFYDAKGFLSKMEIGAVSTRGPQGSKQSVFDRVLNDPLMKMNQQPAAPPPLPGVLPQQPVPSAQRPASLPPAPKGPNLSPVQKRNVPPPPKAAPGKGNTEDDDFPDPDLDMDDDGTIDEDQL